MIKPYYDRDGLQIYHGDCMEIMPMLDRKFDLILTDPPYGINFKYISFIDSYEYMENVLKSIITSYPEKSMAIWQSMKNIHLIHNWYSGEFRIIADINSCPPYRNISIQYCFDPIILINEPKLVPNIKNKDYTITWKPSWHNAKRSEEHIDHPCIKPIESVNKIVKLLTIENQKIIDPFVGSGTTLIAAAELHRQAVGIEIEEKYCEIAAKRIERVLNQGELF